MEVALGTDLDAFVELLEVVGADLWARGIRQWPAGSNRDQIHWFEQQLRTGALLCLKDPNDVLVGGCVLGVAPPGVWVERPGRAAYLHRLAVAPWIGRGWGGRIVRAAEEWALERGRPLLRLDCWDGNEKLRAYYRRLGFRERDAVAVGGYEVRLLEKGLA